MPSAWEHLLDLFYGPRGGASPVEQWGDRFSVALVTAGFFSNFGGFIPRFRTAYAPPFPQHIVVRGVMGTKSSKAEWAKQENFFNSFSAADSGNCRRFLLKE